MFDNFVSLGLSCPVASSMAKYGLRSFSGPFDWLITSELHEVLKCMETEFERFMKQENLEHYENGNGHSGLHFIDRSSGMIFLHETASFVENYPALREKYDRRIERFIKADHRPTCYLRAVRAQNEIAYIIENQRYISNVILRSNADNRIVFLFAKGKNLFVPEDFPFSYYILPGVYSARSYSVLRSFFDGAIDFLTFCADNYPADKIIENLSFDLYAEEKRIETAAALANARYDTLTAMLEHDFSGDPLPDRVMIYGAGNLGKTLYQKIARLTEVVCFVDKKKFGSKCFGLPVIAPEELSGAETKHMIVSTAYDFDEISNQIRAISAAIKCTSLNSLLELRR